MRLKLLDLRRRFWLTAAEYCEDKSTQCYIDYLEALRKERDK